MSTQLVILGFLQKRDLHGYEIKHIIEEHMDDWTSIAFGSIYFALRKLLEEGCIREVSVGRSGNRPSKTVYGITDRGRAEFRRLLDRLWQEPERIFYAFDIALFFLAELPAGRAAELLEERIRTTEVALDHLTAHKQENLADPQVPSIARAIFDHTLLHLQTEHRWLISLRDSVK